MAEEWPGAERLAGLRAEVAAAAGGRAAAEVAVAAAPFRVCPLGAHVDHQGGLTTAAAVDAGILLAFLPDAGGRVRLRSRNYAGECAFHAGAPPGRDDPGTGAGEEALWGHYARGAAYALHRKGFTLERGVVGVLAAPDCMGAGGLSSSAAVGLAVLLALEAANGLKMSHEENIELDRLIENEYLGLRNGILDQTAILLSRRGQLTVIDCAGGRHRTVAAPAASAGARFVWVLAYSGVKKALTSSSLFNDRVQECQDAARELLAACGRPWKEGAGDGGGPILGMVTEAEWREHGAALTRRELRLRAEHFFTEQARVRAGVEAFERGDMAALGPLMTESGESSIRNFEVGAEAMARLRAILLATEGVTGCRFSGAGFRGFCVALFDTAAASPEEIAPAVLAKYVAEFPEYAGVAHVTLAHSSDGARVLAEAVVP